MQISRKELPKNQLELTIEVPVEALQKYLTKAAEDISKEITIEGFRPGKAPYDLVEKQVGAMRIYQHAAELTVQDTYPKAVLEHKLETIGNPKIELKKIAPGNPFVYTAIVSLLPTITLGDYTKFKEKKKDVHVEQKDVDETVNNIRRMYAKEERVQRKAEKGDKVEIDLSVFRDKVPMDGGEAKNQPVMIGEEKFIPGFEDHLIGMSENEKKEFTLKFPKEYHQKTLAGKEALFKVAVKGVYKIDLPALDDAFVKMVGKFETVDDMRRQVEKNIHDEKNEKEQQRFELALLEAVIARSTFGELPDMLVQNELNRMVEELKADIERRSMKFEDYLSSIKKTEDELRQGMTEQAEKRIKSALVMREISKKENITASPEEIEQQVAREKENYKDQPDVIKKIDSKEYKEYLTTIQGNKKVLKLLEQAATEK
ncbi:trigger factor [Patescibacteria group bacterium]